MTPIAGDLPVIFISVVKPLPLPFHFWCFLWLPCDLREGFRVGTYWTPVWLFSHFSRGLKSRAYLLHLYHLFAPLLLLYGSFLAFEIYENKCSSTFYTFSKLFFRICLGLDLISFYLLLESWYFSSLRSLYVFNQSLCYLKHSIFFFNLRYLRLLPITKCNWSIRTVSTASTHMNMLFWFWCGCLWFCS